MRILGFNKLHQKCKGEMPRCAIADIEDWLTSQKIAGVMLRMINWDITLMCMVSMIGEPSLRISLVLYSLFRSKLPTTEEPLWKLFTTQPMQWEMDSLRRHKTN